MVVRDKIIQLINNCLLWASVNHTTEAILRLLEDEHTPVYTKRGIIVPFVGVKNFGMMSG